MGESKATVLQIIPRVPGSVDGVGDYALRLARSLQQDHGVATIFAVANGAAVSSHEGFQLLSGLPDAVSGFDHVILHYANYGYDARGVPSPLRNFARALRPRLPGRWLTMFHELYASGPPWKSAFWMRPFQVKIARDLMDLSDSCFVSNQVIEREIHRHDPQKPVRVLPVMSNFGEPESLPARAEASRNWAICGGSALIERSLGSFLAIRKKIPSPFAPERLEVIGGKRSQQIADQVEAAGRAMQIPCHYHPEVTAERASQILSECSFGWLDYFGRGTVWPHMIFKSGSFAAFCAHGIIPIVSHHETALEIDADKFPGPFEVSPASVRFPRPEQLPEVRRDVQAWYQRHASSGQTARAYAEALT